MIGEPTGNPYEFWTADEIRAACSYEVPIDAVERNWPLLADALHKYGQWSKPSAAGIVGTVKIETASTFDPVREAFWLSEAWRAQNLRYYPYYGRGYIQLTWETNYTTYGNLIGRGDLVLTPDLALDPQIGAEVMACYWRERGLKTLCEMGDWTEVRRRVQGADAGLAEFTLICNRLAW